MTTGTHKEEAAPTHKQSFGFHPLLCYLAERKEALAGILRAEPGAGYAGPGDPTSALRRPARAHLACTETHNFRSLTGSPDFVKDPG